MPDSASHLYRSSAYARRLLLPRQSNRYSSAARKSVRMAGFIFRERHSIKAARGTAGQPAA
jgi:hypothetical protein